MAEYTKQVWTDNVTPADAAHMGHIEDGIREANPKRQLNTLAVDVSVTAPVSNTLYKNTFVPEGTEVTVRVTIAGMIRGQAWVPLKFIYGIPVNGALQGPGHYMPLLAGTSQVILGKLGGDIDQGVVTRTFRLTGLTPGATYQYRVQASITGGMYLFEDMPPNWRPQFPRVIEDKVFDYNYDKGNQKLYLRSFQTGEILVFDPLPLVSQGANYNNPIHPHETPKWRIRGMTAADGHLAVGVYRDEQQVVSFNGAPTGGTFRLSYNGTETGNLNVVGLTAAQLQTAIQALPTLGGATVTGATGGPWTVNFGGAVAGTNVALLGVVNAGLTGGVSPSVNVVQTVRGGGITDLVACAYWGNAVYLIDTETDTIRFTVAVTGPNKVDVQNATTAWVLTNTGNLYPITLATGVLGAAIVTGATTPRALVVDRVNGFAYVTDSVNPTLYRINLSNGVKASVALAANGADGIALSKDGALVFVGLLNGAGTEVRNTSDLSLVTTIPKQTVAAATSAPMDMVCSDLILHYTTNDGRWDYFYIGTAEDGNRFSWYDGVKIDSRASAGVTVTRNEDIIVTGDLNPQRVLMWPGAQFSISPSQGVFLSDLLEVEIAGVA